MIYAIMQFAFLLDKILEWSMNNIYFFLADRLTFCQNKPKQQGNQCQRTTIVSCQLCQSTINPTKKNMEREQKYDSIRENVYEVLYRN